MTKYKIKNFILKKLGMKISSDGFVITSNYFSTAFFSMLSKLKFNVSVACSRWKSTPELQINN